MRYNKVKRLGTCNGNISDSPQPRQKGRLNIIERLYSMVALLKKKNSCYLGAKSNHYDTHFEQVMTLPDYISCSRKVEGQFGTS